MGMKPVQELLVLLRASTPRSFADRYPNQDLVVAEPWEKDRDYRKPSRLHPQAVYCALPRAQNSPVPVGRDARALVQLDHAAVSRLHMVMAYTAEGWKCMDRSSNGTFVNEERNPPQQAVPMPYDAPVRLGRAMVVRLFRPEGFHDFVRRMAEAPSQPVAAPPPPPSPTSDPRASTWRFSAVAPDSLLTADPLGAPEEPAYRPAPPAAPTVRVARPGASAQPPARPPGSEDIDFEFDLDFGDGKGGFA